MCNVLTDMSNGVCGVQKKVDEWEFSRSAVVRIFVESMEVRAARERYVFRLGAQADWRDGRWIETFRIRWEYQGDEEIWYVLRGDREIAGILRPERT